VVVRIQGRNPAEVVGLVEQAGLTLVEEAMAKRCVLVVREGGG